MTLHVKSGGSWRDVTDPQMKISGTWEPIWEGWVRVAGTWQQFYLRVPTVTVSGEVISHSVANGNTARAGIMVRADGTLDKREGLSFTQIDTSTDWVFPRRSSNDIGDDYHVRFEDSAILDPLHGAALDTWHALTSDREVYLEHSTTDTQETQSVTVKISDDGGTTTLDSGTFSLTATVGLPP